mmetsp:Transcript_44291/g.104846  ORF Transcript_44291/g.104846 Transcript_44291/m.104846 type:complete len:113 (-) Transcript_44291:62-400(-)
MLQTPANINDLWNEAASDIESASSTVKKAGTNDQELIVNPPQARIQDTICGEAGFPKSCAGTFSRFSKLKAAKTCITAMPITQSTDTQDSTLVLERDLACVVTKHSRAMTKT